jgi:hypothetical protein
MEDEKRLTIEYERQLAAKFPYEKRFQRLGAVRAAREIGFEHPSFAESCFKEYSHDDLTESVGRHTLARTLAQFHSKEGVQRRERIRAELKEHWERPEKLPDPVVLKRPMGSLL